MAMHDHPVALLISLDKSERLIGIPEPPPREYLVPRQVPFAVSVDETPLLSVSDHRVFRLSPWRASQEQFMRVYNEGRSQTPTNAYVYLEVRP